MELETRAATVKGPAERFTGDVWVDQVAEARPFPSVVSAGIVHFTPGAHSGWHVHATGQTLRILEGVAIVQSRDGTTVLAYPGDTVYTPPGEWHWHGAAEDAFMTHLALSQALPSGSGPEVTWGDLVTDAEYVSALTTTKGTAHD